MTATESSQLPRNLDMLQKLKSLLPHKFKATAVHLLISAVIFAVVLYLILFHWYPGPWFAIDGGWQGVRIMIFVDMVLGPVLTFMVFNPNKTRLALGIDLGFIALVQTGALIWGIYAVHNQRPLAIVFSYDRFYSVDEKPLAKQGLDAEALRHLGKLPVLAYFEWPTDPEKKVELSMNTITLEVADYEQVEYFRPLAPNLKDVFSRQVAMAKLLEEDEELRKKLQRMAMKHGLDKPEDLRYLRFSGRYQEATVIFTPDGKPVGSLPVELEPVDPRKPVKKKAEKVGSRRG